MRVLKQWLPVVLWAGLILATSNDRFSSNQTGGWVQAVFGSASELVNVAVRKLAHIGAYGILAALAWRADRRWFIAIGIALLVASIDEWMQSHTAMRTGTPWDVVLDTAAASLAILLLRRLTGSPAASA